MPYVNRRTPEMVEIKGLDGEPKTVPTGRTVKTQVWVPPEDTREKELRRHGRVIKALTALCLALSVVAVGGLLTRMLPVWAAYGVGGGLFDLFWLVALYTEHLADTRRRVKIAAQGVGLVFMAVSSAAITMDGYRLHVAALGYLLAVIPLGIKGFWWMRFYLVQPPMSAEQQFELENNLGELAVQTRQAEAQLYAKAKLARLAELLEAGVRNEVPQVPNPVPNQAPQVLPTEPEPALVLVPGSGTAAEPVPAAQAEPGSAVRNLFGTDVGNRSEVLRNLVAGGTTETAELRNRLQDAGFAVPSDTYIRRIVRESRHD